MGGGCSKGSEVVFTKWCVQGLGSMARSPGVRASDAGCMGVRFLVCGCPILGVRVSDSRCAGVRCRAHGCPIPGVWVSDYGCAGVRSGCMGVRFRVYGCPIPGVRVSDSWCMVIQETCSMGLHQVVLKTRDNEIPANRTYKAN
jgi:hypothetical protein